MNFLKCFWAQFIASGPAIFTGSVCPEKSVGFKARLVVAFFFQFNRYASNQFVKTFRRI